MSDLEPGVTLSASTIAAMERLSTPSRTAMTKPHPITPPPELVTSLRNSAPHGIRDAGVTRELWLINRAYAAGADQELKACCGWVEGSISTPEAAELRAARRPKPPSLKEQALAAWEIANQTWTTASDKKVATIILRAIKALPND